MKTREFKTYHDLKKSQQNDINQLQILVAFDTKTFQELLQKNNLTIDEIISLGNGCFISKSEYVKLKELNKVHQEEVKYFVSKKENLIQAIKAEMINYEIGYAYDEDMIKEIFDNLYLDIHNKELMNLCKEIYYLLD